MPDFDIGDLVEFTPATKKNFEEVMEQAQSLWVVVLINIRFNGRNTYRLREYGTEYEFTVFEEEIQHVDDDIIP